MYPLGADTYRFGVPVTSKVMTTTASYFSLGSFQASNKTNITRDTYSLTNIVCSVPGYSQGMSWKISGFIDFGKAPLKSAVPSLSRFENSELRLVTGDASFRLGQLYNTKVFHNFCVYAGLGYVNPVPLFNLYFGDNAEQTIDYVKIYKKDLPGLIAQSTNHGESILAGLYARMLIYCNNDEYLKNLYVNSYLYRWETIPSKGIEKTWVITQLRRPATQWEVNNFTDDTPSPPINPMNYGN